VQHRIYQAGGNMIQQLNIYVSVFKCSFSGENRFLSCIGCYIYILTEQSVTDCAESCGAVINALINPS